jgi:CubicO group peptidase (beta-lactamase class C family)
MAGRCSGESYLGRNEAIEVEMDRRENADRWTVHQCAAFVSILILAFWGLFAIWIQVTTPAGATTVELIFLGVLVPMFCILLPLYWMRFRWAYIGGILVILGMLLGAVKAALDPGLFFSLTLYNLLVVLVYMVALTGIYLSIRAYLERPSTGWKVTLLGVGGILLLIAVLGVIVASSMEAIDAFRFRTLLRATHRRVQGGETLEGKIDLLRELGDIPSLAVGVVVGDALVWAQGFGDQPDLDTVYNAGSIAKPVVATAVLQLYERGLLGLDDDVNDYLPFSLRHPDYPDTPVTIRMLLTHQSGLAHYTPQYHSYSKSDELLRWVSARQGWETGDTHRDVPFGEFLEGYLTPGGPYYVPEAWRFEPGTDQGYSTPGYDLLGYVVERVSGQSFGEYLWENVYDPLNMTRTGGSVSESPEIQAVPFERMYGVLMQTNVEIPQSDRRRLGGGGMRTTVPDLAQFLIAHMNAGQSDGFQLLKPETVALMHSPVVRGGGDFMMSGSGMGWSVFTEEPREMWGKMIDLHGMQGHGGADYGYRASMFMVEGDGGAYGYVMLADVSLLSEELDFAWFLAIDKGIEALLLQEGSERLAGASGG